MEKISGVFLLLPVVAIGAALARFMDVFWLCLFVWGILAFVWTIGRMVKSAMGFFGGAHKG